MLTADQAFAILADKLSSRFSTVRKAFLLNKGGGRGDGFIDRREFREALERINIKMSGDEFRKLWKRFDSSGDGKISYTEFNNQIGPMVSPPSMGLKLNRPETPPMKEWMRKAVSRAMRKKVTDIEQTFKDIDTDGSGRISHAEFIQALRKMGVRGVGDTESWQMMSKYRKPHNDTGEMVFEEFRDCMIDYLRVPKGEGHVDEAPSEALQSAVAAIEAAVGKRGDLLIAAFAKYDPDGRNEVDYGQLREVLASVGVTLSKEQFEELCRKFDPIDDGGVYYREMALELTGYDANKKEESSMGQIHNLKEFDLEPITNPITGHPYPHDELARRVAPRVGMSEVEVKFIYHLIGRKQTLKEAFIRYDVNKDGKVRERGRGGER
jgi:Ca2+-binding EF-hand superfamily protein